MKTNKPYPSNEDCEIVDAEQWLKTGIGSCSICGDTSHLNAIRMMGRIYYEIEVGGSRYEKHPTDALFGLCGECWDSYGGWCGVPEIIAGRNKRDHPVKNLRKMIEENNVEGVVIQ